MDVYLSEDLARRIWNNVGYKTRKLIFRICVAYLGWAYHVIPGLGDWAIKKYFDFQQDKKELIICYPLIFREIAEFSLVSFKNKKGTKQKRLSLSQPLVLVQR